VGENIWQLYIRQRTDNKDIQGTQKLNSPKTNEPIKKWATELNRTFTKEEIQMAEKMLTISGIQEMEIKTTLNSISPLLE
jgi:hypothetical protein